MQNSKKSKQATPAKIRHKEFGTVYRIIRTSGIRSKSGATDLYWIIRGVHEDGTEDKGTAMLSVDAWHTGNWEVAE